MRNNYSPKGKLLWDSWMIRQGGKIHLFHLQARPPKNRKERHDKYVTIGHAVSTDLMHWKELPTALKPGIRKSWDNLALWSGGIIEMNKKYLMFYTGRNKKPGEKWIQKIGLATSSDLINWQKYEKNPILEADNGTYDMSNKRNKIGKIGAWRDPFPFYDPKSKKHFLLITARKKGKNKEYNGCIAAAESTDLKKWKLLKPLLAPGVYDEMEVPQMIWRDGYYYLFFATHATNYKPEFAGKSGGHGGLHCFYSKKMFGKYLPVNGNGVVYDHEDEMYDLVIVPDNKKTLTLVGWLNKDKKGKFIGKLTWPMKFNLNKDRMTLIENINL